MLFFLMLATALFAQYPTIPDSAKQRGVAQQALWDSLDVIAWQLAAQRVMAEAKQGKPYLPWCSRPEDLPLSTLPAFPGAEGGGKYSFGGRGGRIFVVTSLADSGPGTLREACEAGGARLVVFNVAGEIRLERPIHVVAPYISIFGQTAPGDGVVVTGQSLLVDTHDVVIRYMRFRRGAMDVAFRDDACGGNGVGNIIYDHCSASWGLDEVMSMYRHVYGRGFERVMAQLDPGSFPLVDSLMGAKLPTCNITIQDCIFAEALDLYNHGFGASIGGHNSWFARNLFANNISRNPSVAMDGDFNFVNNVLYNWWNRSVDGGDDHSRFNIVNNYYKPGPMTGFDPKTGAVNPKASIRYRILKPEASRDKSRPDDYGLAYVSGNVVEGNEVVTADNWAGGIQAEARYLEGIRVSEPFAMPEHEGELLSAEDAYDYVLDHVGATLPARDAVDRQIVQGVREGQPAFAKDAQPHESPYVQRRLPSDSYRLGIITDPQQVGGLPTYKGKPRKDSDGDGIPDRWERSHGLNPRDPDDALQMREDGYMNIEWYAAQILTENQR